MTFEEWLSDKYLGSMELEFSKDAFKAGAASRDAEIAALVAALENIVEYNHDFCTHPEDLREIARAELAKVRKP